MSKNDKQQVPDNNISEMADSMEDLHAQVAEMQGLDLSSEDRESLDGIASSLESIAEDLAAGQVGAAKYGDYLERKEEREKKVAEEKARKKAEALAKGKSEADVVNMYVILTNEKKLGKLHRSQNEFYEIYEEDFAALSKAEVIKLRKDMLEEMEDEALCSYYAESFRQRTVSDRFSVSTQNLNNVCTEPEVGVKADWAIENTQEWYSPDEQAEVRRLMNAALDETRKDLDNQLKPINEGWTKYSTGKNFLLISVSDYDGSELDPNYSNFQTVIGRQLVEVKISSKGIFIMSSTVMNCFPWYWGVSALDIWEAAFNNEVTDERVGASDGKHLAVQALEKIRQKYPKPVVQKEQIKYSPTATQQPAAAGNQQSQSAKKEGCYIATAVYGSYSAPQVIVLRRFRDEILQNTAFGRWFIKTYYRLSPPVAEKLKNAKFINRVVRSILDRWVAKLENRQQ